MLDWFSGIVGYDGSRLKTGRVLECSADGEVLWERDKWETARGSHEAGMQVTKSDPTPAMLEASRELGFLCAPQVLRVSGNPTKFLQGHNVGGPSVSQLGPVLQDVFRAFPDGLRPLDADSVILPACHRARMDITTHVDLDTHENVHEWLRQAETQTRSRHGRAIDSHGTVYWGKNSRRWTIKAYCKHCELKEHPPADPIMLNALLWVTRSLLRIELTLRRLELKDRGTLSDSIVWDYFAKIEAHQMKTASLIEGIENLPTTPRMLLQLWYDGHDVTRQVPRRSFYRHRRTIIETAGIDISLPRDVQDKSAMPAILDLDELRRRELDERNLPPEIQRSLWGAR